MSQKCPICNTQNPDDAGACIQCGFGLTFSQPLWPPAQPRKAEPAQEPDGPSAPDPPQPPPDKETPEWLAAMGAPEQPPSQKTPEWLVAVGTPEQTPARRGRSRLSCSRILLLLLLMLPLLVFSILLTLRQERQSKGGLEVTEHPILTVDPAQVESIEAINLAQQATNLAQQATNEQIAVLAAAEAKTATAVASQFATAEALQTAVAGLTTWCMGRSMAK